MKCGAGDLEIAEQDARAPETQDIDLCPQVRSLCVWSLAGAFAAVNDQSAGIGLKIEHLPVKGGDLDAPAGRLFEIGHQPIANNALE